MKCAALPFQIGLLCAWWSAASAADLEAVRCHELSARVREEKHGDYSHRVQVYLKANGYDRPIFSGVGAASDQLPEAGCLRDSALVLLVGNPVEAGIFVLIFPDGRTVSVLQKEGYIELKGGQAIVADRIYLPSWERNNIPADFLDLFGFVEPR